MMAPTCLQHFLTPYALEISGYEDLEEASLMPVHRMRMYNDGITDACASHAWSGCRIYDH